MTTAAPAWHAKRTDETHHVEEVLRQGGFDQVDAYRYNSASIRVRVIDRRFEESRARARCDGREIPRQAAPGDPARHRDPLHLPPSELARTPTTFREFMQNSEFDDPSPTTL